MKGVVETQVKTKSPSPEILFTKRVGKEIPFVIEEALIQSVIRTIGNRFRD